MPAFIVPNGCSTVALSSHRLLVCIEKTKSCLQERPFTSLPDVSGFARVKVMPARSHARVCSPLKQPRSARLISRDQHLLL
jgi:hypothetical protein